MSKLSIAKELWAYMKERKKWWLAPVFILMAFFGSIILLAENSAIAPLIYTLF